MKRRPLPYGFHYTIPTAFDPSVSYDMQYQRLREIVYSIIDNMEIHIPYMIFTKESHTNDVVTLTGSFYTDHKEVLANKTFSLKGLPDGTYYININAKYKFEPCEPDCSCVKAVSPDSDMTLETVYMPDGGITLYTVVRKNGEITAVDYNDIYTGMHNIAEDAHENRFSDVYAKIKAEVDRATGAEQTLDAKIDAEQARAMDAEDLLDEKIKDEENRATAAEHTLQDNINKEQARAEKAESTLQANLTAEINRARTAESGLQKNIDAEAKSRADGDTAERTRAVAAENTLQQNIDNEVTNRTSADTAERTRALAAEDKLQKNIDNEVANRTAAVTAERERAVNAENELAGDITSESADRQRADTALETKLTGLIQAEETRATQAENDLKDDINTEETARINADSKEINDRTAADTALGKRIDAEITNRTTAVTNEANSRTAADTAERERATAAEENLQTQIAALAEIGPGFKQDIFCKVVATKMGEKYNLSLQNFCFYDKDNDKFVDLSYNNFNELILSTEAPLRVSSAAANAINSDTAKIKIVTAEEVKYVEGNHTVKIAGAPVAGFVKFSLDETGNIILRGIAGGTADNDAVTVEQLKLVMGDKQDKLDNTSEISINDIYANNGDFTTLGAQDFTTSGITSSTANLSQIFTDVIEKESESGNLIITFDTEDEKVVVGQRNRTEIDPVVLTGIKGDITDANSAINYAQLVTTNNRVTAVENKIKDDVIVIPTSNIEVENETVTSSTLDATRICGNIYSVSGSVSFQKSTAVTGGYTFGFTVPNKQIEACLGYVIGPVSAGSEYRNVETTVNYSQIVAGGITGAAFVNTTATGTITFGVLTIVKFKG